MRAGRAALLRTIDIPMKFVIGLLFLGEMSSDAMQIAGCVLIALSTVVAATKGSS